MKEYLIDFYVFHDSNGSSTSIPDLSSILWLKIRVFFVLLFLFC